MSNCSCEVSQTKTIETCEINTPLQAQHRSSVQISHLGTTHPDDSDTSRWDRHPCRASRHTSRIRFPGDALVPTSAGFVAVSTFSSSSFLFSRASCNQSPLRSTCFDALLWPRRLRTSINSLWIPSDLVPDVSSLSQLDIATLFCFFAQQLKPTKSHDASTPRLPRSLVRSPHETVNVIDLVIREATLDEHVVRTPVWINPNTSFHSVCFCHVFCCKEVLQGLSRTSCKSLIPAIRKKSLVQSIFLVSLLLKVQQRSVCIRQVLRGLAYAILAWPTHQEFHRAGEPIDGPISFFSSSLDPATRASTSKV